MLEKITLLKILSQVPPAFNPEETTLLARVMAVSLAFLVAYIFTILELVTSKYPNTFTFILDKIWLHLYGIIYGLFSLSVFLGLDALIESGSLKLEGLGLSNIWWKAVLIGICTKGFLKIRLWNLKIDSTSFPVGPDSIIQIFEPWLLKKIDIQEFIEVRKYIKIRAVPYQEGELEKVRQKIRENLPRTKPEERDAFLVALANADHIISAMELFIVSFGKEAFDLAFPPP